MSDVKVVSRNELYDSQDSDMNDADEVVLPNIQFDIVENIQEETGSGTQENQQDDDEFDFPLFSFGGGSSTKEETSNDAADSEQKDEEERGRKPNKDTNLVRISLRSPSPEVIDQSRPDSYYFTKSTDLEKKQFQEVAVSGDDIWAQSKITHNTMGKLIDLKQYNEKIEKELNREKKLKNIRPGKKRRSKILESRKQNDEREKFKKEEKKKKKQELKRLKYQNNNGFVDKRKGKQISDTKQPKYRTE